MIQKTYLPIKIILYSGYPSGPETYLTVSETLPFVNGTASLKKNLENDKETSLFLST